MEFLLGSALAAGSGYMMYKGSKTKLQPPTAEQRRRERHNQGIIFQKGLNDWAAGANREGLSAEDIVHIEQEHFRNEVRRMQSAERLLGLNSKYMGPVRERTLHAE